MTDSKYSWQANNDQNLTLENLILLFENKIPSIRIKNFAHKDECKNFVRAINWSEDNKIMRYYSVKPKVGYIGTAQVEYRWGYNKDSYFNSVKQAWIDWNKVIEMSWNPLKRFIALLENVSKQKVSIANEDGYGKLFAGIIRKASNGIGRHVDYAPMNSPDYFIAKVNAQLGWNLFVDSPKKGGVTTIYNKPWEVKVKKNEPPPNSYNLSDEHILNSEKFSYKPITGDIVIFNSRNPHEVSAGDSKKNDRMQIGSFIGRLPNKNMILWS